MSTMSFRDDERGYREWLGRNLDGFVINGRRRLTPNYLVLHRASCKSIRNYPGMELDPGGFTERNYVKICGSSVDDLNVYVRTHFGARAVFSKRCGRCKP